MRDIRGDLQDRTSLLEKQIAAVQLQFDQRMAQLSREHGRKIADLKAELQAVRRLIDVTAWHHNVRVAVSLTAAVAGAANEASTAEVGRKSSDPQT